MYVGGGWGEGWGAKCVCRGARGDGFEGVMGMCREVGMYIYMCVCVGYGEGSISILEYIFTEQIH